MIVKLQTLQRFVSSSSLVAKVRLQLYLLPRNPQQTDGSQHRPSLHNQQSMLRTARSNHHQPATLEQRMMGRWVLVTMQCIMIPPPCHALIRAQINFNNCHNHFTSSYVYHIPHLLNPTFYNYITPL